MTNNTMPPKKNKSDDRYGTPSEALDILLPYIKKEWLIWECACGQGSIVDYLKKNGYRIFGTDLDHDFILGKPLDCDCIVTNPPYSLKNHFIRRCYEIGKPFALLMPLTALESEDRQKYFRKYGIELIIPNRRIQYILPDGSSRLHGNWFESVWFTYGLSLGSQIQFVQMRR